MGGLPDERYGGSGSGGEWRMRARGVENEGEGCRGVENEGWRGVENESKGWRSGD